MAEVSDNPTVVLSGDIFSTDGYSRLANNFVNRTSKEVNWVLDSRYQRRKIPDQKKFQKKKLVLHHTPAILFRKVKGAYNVGYTMWETTAVTKKFIENAETMNELWFSSRCSMDAFKDADVPIKKVVPHPLLQGYKFQYSEHDTFRFIAVGTWYARKGWDVLFDAFTTEFDKSDNVELWIKRNRFKGSDYPSLNEMLRPLDVNCKIIDVRKFYDDMGDLYKLCDCFVLPTRGEGFLMPLYEALLTGRDAVVSRCFAMKDLLEGLDLHFIEGEMTKVGDSCDSERSLNEWINKESLWFEPNVDSLKKMMRQAYDDRKTHITKLRNLDNNGIPLVGEIRRLWKTF